MLDSSRSVSFGALLRELRRAAGLTQEALAERSGLGTRSIQQLEAGAGRPRRHTIAALASALALSDEQRARFEAAASRPSRPRTGTGVPAPAPRGSEPLSSSARCSRCAAANPAAASVCQACGGALAAVRPEAPMPSPPVEGFVAPFGALEGERKQVTVLVVELAGAAELAERLDLEATEALLDGAVRTMVAAVRDCEGTVSQVQGDGILALFGAPVAHEDHAVRACYAALALREALGRYAPTDGRTGIDLGLRIALNSGEVVARAVGEASAVPGSTIAPTSSAEGSPVGAGPSPRVDYLARGRTVQLASRLTRLAGAGQIALTAQTLGLVEEYVEVRPLGSLSIGNQVNPIVAFELLGPGPARTRLQALAARGLTPFVGRQRELSALRASLERAVSGRGQVVALVGEPGVGKSRLIREAVHTTSAVGWLIIDSGAVAHARATAYLPIVELLKAYCQIDARDDLVAVRDKLIGKVLGLDRELEPDLPALLALLGVPSAGATQSWAAWGQLDPAQRRRRTIDSVKRLLLRVSQQQPLLLVIEDLHWLDGASQAVLDSLVESLPAARILLLVSYRPEYGHAWGSKTYYAQLRIDALPSDDAAALLDALLGPTPGPAGTPSEPMLALRQSLLDRTEGNAFFLEECIRTLVETGALEGQPGAYQLATDAPTIDVPATVQAVLMARIDRLPPEQKRLLQTAAVVGTDVPYRLLELLADELIGLTASTGSEQSPLRAALGQLQAAELLYEASLFPELEYTFKHALTHDVAYGSLLRDRRRALHARVVQAIEAGYPDRLAELVERLAEHTFRGELWGEAVTYLRQAGAKAADRAASRDAVVWFERALAALDHLPSSRERLSEALDLHLAARHALHETGQYERVVGHLRQAQALAEQLDDRRRQGWIEVYTCTHFYMLGDHRSSVEAGRRALAMAAGLGDQALEAEARSRGSWSHHSLGEYERSIALNLEVAGGTRGRVAFQHFESIGGPPVFARVWLCWSLAELGAFDEGIAFGEEAVEIARSYGHAWGSRVSADCGLGVVYLRRGELARAVELLERSYTLSHTAGIGNWAPISGASLGYAYALVGRLDEALAVLERTADPATAGIFANGSLRVAYLGEALLLAGRLDAARQVAARGLELAEAHQERGHRAWVLRLLGEIASHRDPPDLDEAEAAYHQALSLAEQLGMRPLQAHCRLGLGGLNRRVGRLDAAHADLAAAADFYRSMGMQFWLTRAEAELAAAGEGAPSLPAV